MEFRVDFTSENILPDGSNFGCAGKHNAATRVITPPTLKADNDKIQYTCLVPEYRQRVYERGSK